jgi:hypothetical protein
MASAEYFNRAPQIIGQNGATPSNSTFVQAVYLQLLGRNASQADINFWVGQVATRGRQAVALDFLRSGEYRARVVGAPTIDGFFTPAGYYPTLLKRSASPGEQNYWVGSGIDEANIRIQIEASREFYFIATGILPPN